jgi:hypothetical protein
MSIAPKDVLETYFQTGDEPTAAQFSTLIRSMVNIIDDRYLLGLRTYDTLKSYLAGDTAIYNNTLYECVASTTGPFDPLKWLAIASLGSVVYAGTWDTQANSPALASSVGVKGTYYVVINASSNPADNTALNGIDDWGTSDWAIYNGSAWEKVDNSQAPANASNVQLAPFPGIISTNVQDGMQEIVSDFNTLLQDKMNVVNSATDGHIGVFLSGTIVDSNKQVTDFLPSTTVAADIPFTPPSPLTGITVQSGIVDLKNYTDSSLGTKANLVSPPPTPNDFASLTVTGDIADSGFNAASFLASSTVAANIPFTPFPGVVATNVQNALQEAYGNLDAAKADKVSGAIPGNFSSLIAGGNISDSGFNSSSFLPSSTNASNIAFTPTSTIVSTNIQAAIVELNNKLRKVVIPFSFSGIFTTTSLPFVSVPLEIIVPALTDVYPLATSISAKLYVDYLTQNAGVPPGSINASGEMALGEWTLASGSTVVAGSTTSLPATNNTWTKIISASFPLSAGRTYRVLLRRTAGSGNPQPQMQIEAATLVLTYS